MLKQRFIFAESMLSLIIVFRESTSQEDLYLWRESLVSDSVVSTI
jgi:hypothetical protein